MKYAIRLISVMLLLLLTLNCDDDDPIQYQLKTQVSPEGAGTISPVSALYNEGTEVEIEATANPEYLFKNWADDAVGNENPIKITMTDDMVITAVFEKVKYALSIEIIGEGSVNQEVLAAKASTDYDSGTRVKLTAVPAEEWKFTGWSGDHEGIENPVEVEMKQAMSLTATFEKVQYALNIDIVGNGTVAQSILQAKSSTDYDSGTKVQLTAEPDPDWEFSGWSGDYQGTENPLILTMDKVMDLTANFLPENLEKTHIPDDNFEQALIDLGLDDKLDDYVYNVNIKSVEELNLDNLGIKDLSGIEDFKALKNLSIVNNIISSLDISQNINLEFLLCNDNQLNNLDISNNTALVLLLAGNNPLECVLVNQTQFEKLFDIPWMHFGGYFADEGVCFSLDCDALSTSTTYVPDDNFEQALIDMGRDDVLDNYVKTIDIAGLRGLDLSGKNISDLTGIQDFIILLSLDCSDNNISDISQLLSLRFFSIDLSNNQISSIDLTEFGCIYDIDLRGNPLSCIQVSEEQLQCMEEDNIINMEILKDEDVQISLDCD